MTLGMVRGKRCALGLEHQQDQKQMARSVRRCVDCPSKRCGVKRELSRVKPQVESAKLVKQFTTFLESDYGHCSLCNATVFADAKSCGSCGAKFRRV
jgi:hypothetical protein